jgi:hypothetical protein
LCDYVPATVAERVYFWCTLFQRIARFPGVGIAKLGLGIMRAALANLLVLVLSPVVCAQETARVTVTEGHSTASRGSVNQSPSTPPDIVLVPRGEDARRGRLWILNTGNGLLIAGDIEGGRPDFPADQSSLLAKDHVEVWLAADVDPVLPPIGWGNQFGQNALERGAHSCEGYLNDATVPADNSPESVQKCRERAAQQQKYRSYFQRLFLRQWLLVPGYAIESFAAPAYDQIVSRFAGDGVPSTLNPHGTPEFQYSPSSNGYRFQILIPYVAFPPLPSLELRDLRLLVDVFSAAKPGKKMGSFSSSSPSRLWGNPGTFNGLRLNPPRVF